MAAQGRKSFSRSLSLLPGQSSSRLRGSAWTPPGSTDTWIVFTDFDPEPPADTLPPFDIVLLHEPSWSFYNGSGVPRLFIAFLACADFFLAFDKSDPREPPAEHGMVHDHGAGCVDHVWRQLWHAIPRNGHPVSVPWCTASAAAATSSAPERYCRVLCHDATRLSGKNV
ncbi:hypothetical protein BC828DRAFT_42151 [Blastocladiella britannica]|nr:hypothetical protein BC828DRAFT_42151 [Blastocladiella britannica]